jgi:hypothetical protein
MRACVTAPRFNSNVADISISYITFGRTDLSLRPIKVTLRSEHVLHAVYQFNFKPVLNKNSVVLLARE